MEDKFGTGLGSAGYVAIGRESDTRSPFPLHSPPGHYTVEHDPDDLWDDSRIIINLGPTHPAMHGSFRMVAKSTAKPSKSRTASSGTRTGQKKNSENTARTTSTWFSPTGMNYCSALINNVTYALSVERLMGIEVPPRCTWIRMMACEISRIIDHLICVGIGAVDVGAFSYFLYGFHQREEAYTLIEKLCGARLTTSYTRIGGLMYDAAPGLGNDVRAWVKKTRKVLEEMDRLLTTNKIFCQRTQGVGKFTKQQALEYSFAGPSARASGWDRDLRRDQPVMFYPEVEFDVAVGTQGDVYDRYLVRVEEMAQSLRILEQCCDRLEKEKGPCGQKTNAFASQRSRKCTHRWKR